MKLTLRKSAALQNAIQEAVRNIDVKIKVDLNEFENAEQTLASANERAIQNDQRRETLTEVLYFIRAQVGQANATSGINGKLARCAFIDKRIGQLQGLTSTEALQESLVVVSGKLDKIRNEKGEHRRTIYGYNDTISTGVFNQGQVDGFKSQIQTLKKEKQKLNDEILELNVRTEIELNETTVTTLQQEGLI
jgi:hypothetical protein